jgi:hypothetical protein
MDCFNVPLDKQPPWPVRLHNRLWQLVVVNDRNRIPREPFGFNLASLKQLARTLTDLSEHLLGRWDSGK